MAVTENGFMGMGIGAAMTGLRPIVEGMNMGFLLLAYNQISNNAGMLHYTSGGQYKVGLALHTICIRFGSDRLLLCTCAFALCPMRRGSAGYTGAEPP